MSNPEPNLPCPKCGSLSWREFMDRYQCEDCRADLGSTIHDPTSTASTDLRGTRMWAGLTLGDLSRRSNLTLSKISSIERAEVVPTRNERDAIDRAVVQTLRERSGSTTAPDQCWMTSTSLVRNLRVTIGMSLRETAEALGVTPTELGEVERGVRAPLFTDVEYLSVLVGHNPPRSRRGSPWEPTCPDCGHPRDNHHSRESGRFGECRYCPCGHGTYKNEYQRREVTVPERRKP